MSQYPDDTSISPTSSIKERKQRLASAFNMKKSPANKNKKKKSKQTMRTKEDDDASAAAAADAMMEDMLRQAEQLAKEMKGEVPAVTKSEEEQQRAKTQKQHDDADEAALAAAAAADAMMEDMLRQAEELAKDMKGDSTEELERKMKDEEIKSANQMMEELLKQELESESEPPNSNPYIQQLDGGGGGSNDLEDMLKRAKQMAHEMTGDPLEVSQSNPQEEANADSMMEDMLRDAKKLAVDMGPTVAGGNNSTDDSKLVADMLQRAEKLAQEMKSDLPDDLELLDLEPEDQEIETANSTYSGAEVMLHDDDDSDESIDSMLLKAGNLAAQMRTPNGRGDSAQASASGLPTPDGTATPRVEVTPGPAEVSNDDESDGDGVETMLLKAELLSKTIRSAANGQMNTPELLRASDEILQRAKAQQERAMAHSSNITNTPQLLARAKSILEAPLENVMSADDTVDTRDTFPVRNSNHQHNTRPTLVHNARPPRPPSQRSVQPVTPSPRGVQSSHAPQQQQRQNATHKQKEAANENGDHLARAIEALQSMPTKKAPGSPIMPQSVALQRDDSDDMSSVGSGSFMRNMSISSFHHQTTTGPGNGESPERETIGVTTLDNVEHDDNSHEDDESHSMLVAYAEDLAQQMAQALEETLSTNDPSLGRDLESPQQPRKLANQMRSPPPPDPPKKDIYANDEEYTSDDDVFVNTNEELGNTDAWAVHDAMEEPTPPLPAASLQAETKVSNDLMRRTRKLDVKKVQWETVDIPDSSDDDYVPMQDFRRHRSLGVGQMPAAKSTKQLKQRKLRRKKAIRAFIVGMICLALVVLAAKLHYDDDASISSFTVSSKQMISDMSVSSKQVFSDFTVSSNQVISDMSVSSKQVFSDFTVSSKQVISGMSVSSKQVISAMTVSSKQIFSNLTDQLFPDEAVGVSNEPKPVVETKVNQVPETIKKVKKTKQAVASSQQAPSVEKKQPPIEKKVKPIPPKKTRTPTEARQESPVLKKEPVVKAAPVMNKKPVAEAPIKQQVPTRTVVAQQKHEVVPSKKETVAGVTLPEKIEKTPKRCYIPLGYIVFAKCRRVAVYDAQGIADSMLQ